MPPEAVTGVKAVAAVPAVSVVLAIALVATTDPFTVRVNVALTLAPRLSVPVTVKTVAVNAAAGVPVIWPVAVLSTRFVGSAGLME